MKRILYRIPYSFFEEPSWSIYRILYSSSEEPNWSILRIVTIKNWTSILVELREDKQQYYERFQTLTKAYYEIIRDLLKILTPFYFSTFHASINPSTWIKKNFHFISILHVIHNAISRTTSCILIKKIYLLLINMHEKNC